MPAPKRFLGEQAQTVETRAIAMRKPLERWLRRASRYFAAEALEQMKLEPLVRLNFRKARPPDLDKLIEELRAILSRYGVQQISQAIQTGAATVGAEISITDFLISEFMAQKEIKIVEIVEATRKAGQDAIREIITEALSEEVRPSTTELGRRLRNRLNFGTTAEGRSFAFSPARAQLIARTEMVQAQNTGIVQGYRLAGVRRHKWISYQDGRSGRGHDAMNGQIVAVGEFFRAPDGTRLLYPGDPDAPIRHTANCRCTTVPVVSRDEMERIHHDR